MPQTDLWILIGLGGLFILLGVGAFFWAVVRKKAIIKPFQPVPIFGSIWSILQSALSPGD